MKRAREGEMQQIEGLCSSTWKTLYNFIYFKVQNRQEAEDITQETYVRALPHFQKNDIVTEKYLGFLKTISLNIIRDKWRSNKRRGIIVDIEAIENEKAAAQDQAEEAAVRTVVKEALNRLNEEQRTVIELRIIKGYSSAETAKIMNKKEGTVRVLQYRALEALAELLGKEEYLKEV